MAFGKTKQLLLLSAIWIILVFLVSFLGGSAFRGNDLSLLAILVVLNAAVTFTVAYMQLRVLQKCAIRVPGSSAWDRSDTRLQLCLKQTKIGKRDRRRPDMRPVGLGSWAHFDVCRDRGSRAAPVEGTLPYRSAVGTY